MSDNWSFPNNHFSAMPHSNTYTFINDIHSSVPYTYDNIPFFGHHSSLLTPYPSVSDSSQVNAPYLNSSTLYHQPLSHPHERFLKRTEQTCPPNLTGRKRTNWFKTARKANENQQILSVLPLFQSFSSASDAPIHIHRRTSLSLVQGLIYKLSYSHLFAIDTESDKPSLNRSFLSPALLQVQAIYDETYSLVLLFEVQHLPHSSSHLFHLIQRLCHVIFSTNNMIFAWGDVHHELSPFEQFHLFNLSDVTKTLNLQELFTTQWNQMHPHTVECIARHQPPIDDSDSDDILICLINTDDLNDDFNTDNPLDDYSGCICPAEIRPYKMKKALWSLQKAIQMTFHQALDKSMTMNIWSCGLDLSLQTWKNDSDQLTRNRLICYAINDVFACTQLYFHTLKHIQVSQPLDISIPSSHITADTLVELPSYFVLSDSHGRYLPPIIVTPSCKIIIKAISGLHWAHSSDTHLCARSFISSPHASTYLSSCKGVLFLIGTNSVRHTLALAIIDQITEIIDIIRLQYSHLCDKASISIVNVFPCYKTSLSFPSISSLLSNIDVYNTLLNDLSRDKHFSVLDLQISAEHLSTDRMHINCSYLSLLYERISNYFVQIRTQKSIATQTKCRSQSARSRRNKRRHDKAKLVRKPFIIKRFIDHAWSWTDLKSYLRYRSIKYSRLLDIVDRRLYIQFRNRIQQQRAECLLAETVFDQDNYLLWISHTRFSRTN